MTLSLSQILIIIAVVGGIIALVLLTRPRLSIQEQYLLKVIQMKSPQIDNIRLFMWVKSIVHPINGLTDLEFQKTFLEDPELFKQKCEIFHFYGPNALYPLLGFEAINWNLDPTEGNPLVTRLAASQVCRRFPHTAEVIEDLFIKSPDSTTSDFITHGNADFPDLGTIKLRYKTNLLSILRVIATTSRNEWWPGTSPDIREWAEMTLKKYESR
jgi:hypothetical protein